MQVTPYKDGQGSKKEQVAKMFNNISKRYDLLNHLLSLGIDIVWRKQAIKKLKEDKPKILLDVATGTGDFAIEALALAPEKVIGIDISEGMLEHGRIKMRRKGLDDKIELLSGDSEHIPFEDNKFDAITVGYGVRNFEDLEAGLREMYRVLKPGGKVVILEFSRPRKFPFKQIYNFYFKHILPLIGRVIAKDRSAYTYLPESVQYFPDGQDFLNILEQTGFNNTQWDPLTFGISSIYTGRK
jgi:demethylmenaquinone methyltransferase/2-methoxy-6-polyprenyl-1,4-benzoquinol methylase